MTKTHKANWGTTPADSRQNYNEYTPKSWMRGDSIQAAYTIGGIGLKYARTNYDNTAFSFDTKIPRESQVVGLSLAF